MAQAARIGSPWERRILKWLLRLALVVLAVSIATQSYRYARTNSVNSTASETPPLHVMTLITGQTSKEYHRLGGLLSGVINRSESQTGQRLVIRPSTGSKQNLRALIAGEADLGFVQAQVLYPNEANEGPIKEMRRYVRVIAQVLPSAMTLVAADASEIERIEDLQGKRVGVLSFSSTDWDSFMDLMAAAGQPVWVAPADRRPGRFLTPESQAPAPVKNAVTLSDGSINRLIQKLKRGELDAIFTSIAHPSPLVRRFLVAAPVHFVPIGLDPERLRLQSQSYHELTIPTALYPILELGEDVSTVGSQTLLVTAASASEDEVYALTKVLYESVAELKKSPVFREISAAALVDGLPIHDLHPGAARFYREKRLIAQNARGAPEKQRLSMGLLTSGPGTAPQALSTLLERAVRGEGPAAPETLGVEVNATDYPADDPLINRIVSGEYAFGLFPAEDVKLQAPTRKESLKRLRTSSLRTVCRLPGELAHLAASEPLGLQALRGLSGKRVGVVGGDAQGVMQWIEGELEAMALPLPQRQLLEFEQLDAAWQAGELDAVLFFDSVPSKRLNTLHSRRPLRLIPLVGQREGTSPGDGYKAVRIPSWLYPASQSDDIASFTRPFTLVSSTLIPKEQVEALTRAILEPPLPEAPPFPPLKALPEGVQGPPSLQAGVIVPGFNPEGPFTPLWLLGHGEQRGILLDKTWLSGGKTFPRHEGAGAFDRLELPAQTSPSPSQTPDAAAATGTPPVPTATPAPASTPDEDSTTRENTPPPSAFTLTAGNPESAASESASGIAEIFNSLCRPSLTGDKPCRPGSVASLLTSKDAETAIDKLLEGQADFALVQADLIHDAVNGQGHWQGNPQSRIRAVATVYMSAFTVLASNRETLGGHVTGGGALKAGENRPKPQEASTIEELGDLEGRRVSIRHAPGTGPRSNAITLFNREVFFSGLWRYSLIADEPVPLESSRLFMDGSIMALFFMAPHPASWVDAILRRNAQTSLLPLTGLEGYLEEIPYLSRAVIDTSVYSDETAGRQLIPTIGIPFMLITTEDAPKLQVRTLLATLLGEAEALRKRYPVLGQLSLDFMAASAGLKQHDEAESFYRKAAEAAAEAQAR